MPKKLVWTACEARLVGSPWRYAFRELVRPELADYSLRHGAGRISLRHQSGDIDIFRKFYVYGYYDWPPEVIAGLRQLGRPLNVLDLGANIGLFGVHTRAHLPIARVVSFEPDPANADVLDHVLAANGGDWENIRACAANHDGTAMFKSGAHNFSRIASEGDAAVPTVDVFPYVAGADLVKMNIEGSEWEILEDPRLKDTAAAWIVEYHRIRNPGSDITSLAQRSFERCGYRTRVATAHGGNGLLWAWKEMGGATQGE
ncbi:MAG: FkbM family methyltransferase [Solirubrobacteraceae bacterium]